MNIKNIRLKFLSLLQSIIILTCIPGLPLWIEILLLIPICTLTVMALLVTAYFYYSLPDVKKSLLTHLMIFVMVLLILMVVWLFGSTIVMNNAEFLRTKLTNSPLVTCTLLKYEHLAIPAVTGITFIIACKALLVWNPFLFLKMNHEKWLKIVLTSILGISITLFVFGYKFSAIMCGYWVDCE